MVIIILCVSDNAMWCKNYWLTLKIITCYVISLEVSLADMSFLVVYIKKMLNLLSSGFKPLVLYS